MDGVCLVLDGGLRITDVGWTNWDAFSQHAGWQPPRRAEVVGRSVVDCFTPGVVRDCFRTLFLEVLDRKRPRIRTEYRCDAPDMRRQMRMSVTPIAGAQPRLLYQSITLLETPRPPMRLYGAPAAGEGAEDLIIICSICADVAWPEETGVNGREWIDASEYYRRGGGDPELISHGFCDRCFTTLMATEGC